MLRNSYRILEEARCDVSFEKIHILHYLDPQDPQDPQGPGSSLPQTPVPQSIPHPVTYQSGLIIQASNRQCFVPYLAELARCTEVMKGLVAGLLSVLVI